MKYRTGLLTFCMFVCAALTASAQLRLGGSARAGAGVTGSAGRNSGSVGLNSGTQLGTRVGHTVNGSLNSATQASATAQAKSRKSAAATNTGVTSQVQSSTQAGMETASSSHSKSGKDRRPSSQTAVDVNSAGSTNASLGRGSADVNGSTGAGARVNQQGLGSRTNVQSNTSANADANVKSGKRK